MQFQFNSDNRVAGDGAVPAQIEEIVLGKLKRVGDRLTRVEVHVGDVNGARGGDDRRSVVELRPKGMDPISGTAEAASIEAAVVSATEKALSAYERQIGKQTTRKGH
jgi:hypothetical protein